MLLLCFHYNSSGAANQLRGFCRRPETSSRQCFRERSWCVHGMEQAVWQLEHISYIAWDVQLCRCRFFCVLLITCTSGVISKPLLFLRLLSICVWLCVCLSVQKLRNYHGAGQKVIKLGIMMNPRSDLVTLYLDFDHESSLYFWTSKCPCLEICRLDCDAVLCDNVC